ncbi:MAG: VWA domain-containing protein [Holophagales bacterium]|nr:VWA domain-containing protein [Holophagales bacterium]
MARSIVLSCFLLANPGVRSASAQAPGQIPRVTGSVELSLVNVDVVVTGRDGKPVEGLTAADFTVLHEKKPVAVTNFREEKAALPVAQASAAADPSRGEPVPAATAVPASEAVAEERRVRRHVAIFIDHLALPDVKEREQVFGSLKSLLRRTLQPGDAAMIASWRGGVQVVYPFTGDVALLERQLDAVATGAIRLGRDVQEELDRLAGDDWAYAWAGAGDSSLSRNLNVQQAYSEVKGKATALKGLIATMAGMEGRKVLVFVSRSFSRRPGAEFFGTTMDTVSLIDSVTEKANAAGVTIHSLYAAAWESESPNVANSPLSDPRSIGRAGLTRSESKRVNEMASLEKLADRTGESSSPPRWRPRLSPVSSLPTSCTGPRLPGAGRRLRGGRGLGAREPAGAHGADASFRRGARARGADRRPGPGEPLPDGPERPSPDRRLDGNGEEREEGPVPHTHPRPRPRSPPRSSPDGDRDDERRGVGLHRLRGTGRGVLRRPPGAARDRASSGVGRSGVDDGAELRPRDPDQ